MDRNVYAPPQALPDRSGPPIGAHVPSDRPTGGGGAWSARPDERRDAPVPSGEPDGTVALPLPAPTAPPAPPAGSGFGGPAAAGGTAPGPTVENPDMPPHEKLVRYFPEASLALYVALDPMLRQAFDGTARDVSLFVALALAGVLGWLYLTRVWNVRRTSQIVISEVALILYVAAIGGPFTAIDGYDTILGAIAAVIFTAFIAFLPAPQSPDR